MENIITAQGYGAGGHHDTKWVNDEDPHFPCNTFDDPKMIQQCYLMQTSWMLTMYSYDYEKVIAACSDAPATMTSTCFKSLGRDIAGQTLRDPTRIVQLCSTVPKEHRAVCMTGALNVIIDFWGEKLTDQATKLCTIAGDEREECYNILARRINLELFEHKEDTERVCATFEPDMRPLCSAAR